MINATRSFAGGLRKGWIQGVAAALVVLGLLLISVLTGWATTNPSVLIQAAVTGLLLGGVYGLVAIGLALIFGVLDVLNFAHGALMALAMYASYVLVSSYGFDPYLSIIVTVVLLFVVGAVIQRTLIEPVMGQGHEKQLLLTLGLSLIIVNALLLFFSSDPRSVSSTLIGDFLPSEVNVFGAVASTPRIIAFVGAMALAGLLYWILYRTKLGTAIRSVSENAQGAAMVGIDVRRIQAFTFGLGAACAGAAGTLILPFISLQPATGEQYNIIAFVIVVLGGLGNTTGALVGGLLVGLTQELGGAIFPELDKQLIVFVIFVLVLLFRPQGLLGKSDS